MNLINQWAKLINEDFRSENPDDFKDEKNTIRADEYEQLQKEIAEINKEFEKKNRNAPINEEEDEDSDEPSEEVKQMSDEIEKKLKSFEDNGVDEDPEYVAIHDELSNIMNDKKLSNAEKRSRIATIDKRLKDYFNNKNKKGEEKQKKVIVFERVLVTKSNATRDEIENARSNPDFWKMDSRDEFFSKPTVEMDILETPVFDTEKEAADYVSKEISKFAQKYHVRADEFTNISKTEDVTHVYKQNADSEKKVVVDKKNAIPTPIKEVDPNAFGWVYSKIEDNDTPRTFHVEFIIYKAEEPVPYSDGLEDFWDGWNYANNPDWRGIKKEREERRKEYENRVRNLDAEISEYEKNSLAQKIESAILKLINNNNEQKVVDVLKKFFDDKTDDELSNMTADDFISFSLPKMKAILGMLDNEAKEKFSKDGDVVDDETGDVELSSDEEILAAARAEKEGRDIEDVEKEMKSQKSKDGYASRGDETKADQEDREDAESAEKEREKEEEEDKKASDRENDSDDYEGSQDDTGSVTGNMMNKQEYKKADSKLSMHGVSITKKFMDYLKSKPKSEWPKNADEVKKMKKKVNAEWGE